MSVALSRGGEWLVRRARLERRMRELETVDTPNNQGKLGRLLLVSGRPRQALPKLEAAFAAEPRVLEWPLALGRLHLEQGEADLAGPYFARVVHEDPGFGYGEPWLGLAEAALTLGRSEDAIGALEEHDRRHGPNPRSAYLRGRCLRSLGRSEEARAAFSEVFRLRSELPAYQQGHFASLAWKAFFARLS